MSQKGTSDDRRDDSNPYLRAGDDAAAAATLDAEMPYLRTEDVRRLNRKALMFLAGIVVLLVCAALWFFGAAMGDADERGARAVRQDPLVIPAAPRDLPELPDPPPQLPPPAAYEDLPPLPVQGPDPTAATRPAFEATQPKTLSLLERRMLDVAAGASGPAAAGDGVAGMLPPDEYARLMLAAGQPVASTPPPASSGSRGGARPLYNPGTLLLRGTYIRCVLQSRVVSDFPGYTSCVVTEPVYSVTGQRLLLPRGSRVSGAYDRDAVVGDRVAVVWDRITTPTGLDVEMRSPGTDMLGAAGTPGAYTAHWGQRIGSALLISMLSDAFKYAGAKHGPQEAGYASGIVFQSPYESNTARTMERLAQLALERNMARPPTVTIQQGTIVNVYVARDIDFSAVLQ